MPRIPKDTKVVYRKLGQERAFGQAHIGRNKIEIDQRLFTKRHLKFLLHEKMHLQNPEWSETKVLKQSREMADFLWQNNFRWCDL